MRGDRDPATREAVRGVGAAGITLVCMALVAATVATGYVLVAEFVLGR
jgi:hypothetical protein